MKSTFLSRNKANLITSLSAPITESALLEQYPQLGNFVVKINYYRYNIPSGLFISHVRTLNLPLLTPTPQLMSLAILRDLTTSQDMTSIEEVLGEPYNSEVIYLQELVLLPKVAYSDNGEFSSAYYVLNSYGNTLPMALGSPADIYNIGSLDWEIWLSNEPIPFPTYIQEWNTSSAYAQEKYASITSNYSQYLLSLPFFCPVSYNISLNIEQEEATIASYTLLGTRLVATSGEATTKKAYEFRNTLVTGDGSRAFSDSHLLDGTTHFKPTSGGAVVSISQKDPTPTGEDIVARVAVTALRVTQNTFYRNSAAIPAPTLIAPSV